MIRKSLLQISLFCILILQADFALAQRTKDVGNPRLLLPVRQGLKWGYADTAKNIVITPQYDAANAFSNGLAIVEKDKKAFAIDQTGKVLTPGFDNMVMLEDTLLSIYLNQVSDTLGGWGICTRSGFLILPPAYDEVVRLDADLFSFRKDSLWGVVNRNGVILLPPAYDVIDIAYRDYLRLRKDKKYGLIGRDGKRYLDDIYSEIYLPNKWIIGAYMDKETPSRAKGWGAYDQTPEIFIPFGADSLFRVNAYFVGVKEKDSLACYFSRAAKNYTPFIYKSIFSVDLYWAQLVDFEGRRGLVDTSGKIIVPVSYADITIGGNGNWFVADKNKNWGFYNTAGELKLAPSYSSIQPFRSVVTVVFNGNLQGLVNISGELLVPPGNQEIIIRGNTAKVIRPDNSATFIKLDANGKIIDQSTYDEFRVIKIGGLEAAVNIGPDGTITPSGRAFFPVVDSLDWFMNPQTMLWGLRNTFTNDTLIPAQFYSVDPTRNGFTIVSLHQSSTGIVIDGKTSVTTDRYGLVNDSTGKIVLKPTYSSIRKEDLRPGSFNGFVRATLANGAMALVTTDGSERTMSFTYIDNVQNGYARICIGGKWTIEDPGERITDIFHFCTEQSINPVRTFGPASTSPLFMEKSICIAGGKWGYVDNTGRVIIAAAYDGAKQVTEETGIVKRGKKWGVIDMTGAIKIPFVYDVLYYMEADTNTFIIAQTNGIRYGYVDRNGNIQIPADLKQSKVLGNGYIGFTKTGKWGVINSRGMPVCAEKYHEILPFSEGKAAVRLGNKWGYIDTLGTEIIAPAFEKAGQFNSGAARIVKNQRWGFIDQYGATIIEPKYMQAGNFSGNAAPLRTRDGFGLIGKEGKWLQKPVYQKVSQLDSSLTGFFVLRNESGSAVCKADGKIFIPAKYEAYKYLGEGMIGCRNGKDWMLLDTTGKIISKTTFEQIKPFSEHFAGASQNGKWGFINRSGKFVVQPQYSVVGKFVDHLAYAYVNLNSYIIDTTGKVKIRFDKAATAYLGYSEGKYVLGRLNTKREIEKQYYLTRHGVRVNRIDYREALLFQDGAARVRSDGPTWGLISFTGYYLIKPRFFVLGPFEYGLARFQMRYTLGVFSLDGKPVLPVGYDAVYYDDDLEKIRFEKGNALGYLFRDGTVCWPESE
ncbi:MAG: WG repeat-containing protein [Bacteroidota bacterium]|nr:WG repeat-containing protein [Bacteroidota bacterium]